MRTPVFEPQGSAGTENPTLSIWSVFNLGEYGVAAKPPSGRIALHLERF